MVGRAQPHSRKDECHFWVPYCGYGPGWCAKKVKCLGGKKMLFKPSGEPVRGCSFLRLLHPWTGLSAEAFRAIVEYAYRHPLRVKRGAKSTTQTS